ncbi:MAG: 50S ribosomal protein L29 [Puniceicoccales bacterium]|jgi:large subunit ribosomal protein L29|nr:50S ribosomal protein L29 [Puniceicoccales bacterium]
MKAKEFRSFCDEDLIGRLNERRNELLRLHLRRRSGPTEKHHQFPLLRRDIARIETILRERAQKG